MPVPIRFDADLVSLLKEGARRTHHKRAALVRLTLRRHLRAVIEAEEEASPAQKPLTNVKPWPKGVLAKAYARIGKEDEAMENAALRARPTPSMED